MDKKLKKIIIEAFECGAKWNKQKGHYLNALDFIEENKKQLNLYSVVKQSELLCEYCGLPLQEGVNLDYCKNDYCTRND